MPKAETEYVWNELEPGIVITEPGNSRDYHTGDWRALLPVLNKDRCIRCGICWVFCPDIALHPDDQGYYLVDLKYCKGCGICARECPTGAIHMEKEKES